MADISAKLKEKLLATLTHEYTAWLKANDLPLESADEAILNPGLSKDQIIWLTSFIRIWEAVSEI